jgi:hypothetical protein
MDPKDQKIALLEQKVAKLLQQLAELHRRTSFLERENTRRRAEVNQMATRKG